MSPVARQFRLIGSVFPIWLHPQTQQPSKTKQTFCFSTSFSISTKKSPDNFMGFIRSKSLDGFSYRARQLPILRPTFCFSISFTISTLRPSYIQNTDLLRPDIFRGSLEVNLGIVSRSELSSPLDCSNRHFFTCFSTPRRKREFNIVAPNAHGIGSDFT